MNAVLGWIVDRPLVAGTILAGLTLVLALAATRVEMDTSAEGLMVQNDPARTYYEQVKRAFGSDNLTVVLVQADDVFTTPVLQAVKNISDALERFDGVTRVESLTTVNNIRGDAASLNTDPLVGAHIPTDGAELQRIRADALSNRVFVGNLVAKDGRATAIVAYTAGGRHFNKPFTERLERLIAREAAPGLRIFQFGDPLTKVTYGRYIEQDQLTLIPFSIAVLLIVLFLAFRTLQGVVVPLVTGVVSIVWTVGLMSLVGIPLNAMTAAVPSLLIAIGFTEDVHMLAAYHELIERGGERLASLRTMLRETGLPMLVTSATTALGFLTLTFTDITVLIQFGWAAALGLTANFVVTMIAVPLVLRRWPAPRGARATPLEAGVTEGPIPRFMEWMAPRLLRHRWKIWAVTALVVAASLVGWSSLRVDTDFMSYFPERSEIRQRADELHRSLAGGVVFYIVVETGVPDGVKSPVVLNAIARLQDDLAATGRIDTTISLADYIRRMHREMNGGDPRFEVIPDTPEQVAQYLLLLEGKELAKYVDFNGSTANIVVRHNVTSSWALSALLADVHAFATKSFPGNVRVRTTGETILVNNAADYIAVNEFTSFGSTLLIIGIIHAVLFMSLRAGFLSLIPNVIPIFCSFGVMGLLGIPLNTGTAMVATVAIGIAVDDTVHHMVTYNRQLNLHNDQTKAMVATLKAQGRPVMYVSVALAAGFFVLMFSNFVPTTQLGLLSGIVMLIAMVCELVLTPLLMHSTRLVTLWNVLLVRMDPTLVKTAPLLQGLSRWEARKLVLLGGLRALRPGQLLIRAGDSGNELFMVVSGRVRVFALDPQGRERTLTVLGPSAVLGEVAMVGNGVRSASVVAETDTEVLAISYPSLERIRKRFPFTAAKMYRNLAGILSARLRERTDELMLTQMVKPVLEPVPPKDAP
jgi:predicted RND superfamily exporter protein